jgi:hypothetical protein
VGQPGNLADSVRIGQFVLSANDGANRFYSLTLGYNNGVPGSAVQFGTGTFCMPSPGALALLSLIGASRRRER